MIYTTEDSTSICVSNKPTECLRSLIECIDAKPGRKLNAKNAAEDGVHK